MLKLIIKLLLCSIILQIHPAFAAIYMVQETNGSITYSDTPLPNSVQIEVPETNTTQALQATTTVTETETTMPQLVGTQITSRKNYKTFFIKSPKPEETFQNQPIIPVEVVVEPELQKGDKVQLFLDGKPFGEAAAMTQLGLAQVERGTHQVSAVIIDSNQRVLKQADPVTIFVHKTSILNPPAASANTSNISSSQSRTLVRMLFQLLI